MGIAGCGNLILDATDNWVKGYECKLGQCDVLHVDMWVMLMGLELRVGMAIWHHLFGGGK